MSFSVSSTSTQPRVDFTPLSDTYSIKNNEGYTITMSEDSNTIHLKDKFADEIQGLIQVGVDVRPEEIDSADPSAHFESLVKRRIKVLAQSKDKFGFQVHKEQGPEGEKYAVKFGQYGLAGGIFDGRRIDENGEECVEFSTKESVVGGILLIAATGAATFGGNCIAGTPGGAVGAGATLGAGFKTYQYVTLTPVDDMTLAGGARAAGIGGVAGGAAGGVATVVVPYLCGLAEAALPGVAAGLGQGATSILAGTAKGIAGDVTRLFVEKVLDEGETPTKEELAKTAALGAVGGAVFWSAEN